MLSNLVRTALEFHVLMSLSFAGETIQSTKRKTAVSHMINTKYVKHDELYRSNDPPLIVYDLDEMAVLFFERYDEDDHHRPLPFP